MAQNKLKAEDAARARVVAANDSEARRAKRERELAARKELARNQYEVTWPGGVRSQVNLALKGGGDHLFNANVKDPKHTACRTKTLWLTLRQALGLKADGYELKPDPEPAKTPKAKGKGGK